MYKSPLITQKKIKHKLLFSFAFCLSSFISMAQNHKIDSVDLSYQNNALNIYVQSFCPIGIETLNREEAYYLNDTTVVFDIYWKQCAAYFIAQVYEEHQVEMDSVPADVNIAIRLYYDTNTVNFDSNDPNHCTYRYTYFLLDSLYLSVSDQQNFSLDDLENDLNLQYYPNPVVNELVVLGDFKAVNNISVYEISGKQIYFTDVFSSEKIKINTSEWQEGVYFISIRTKRGVIRKRIVKVTN